MPVLSCFVGVGKGARARQYSVSFLNTLPLLHVWQKAGKSVREVCTIGGFVEYWKRGGKTVNGLFQVGDRLYLRRVRKTKCPDDIPLPGLLEVDSSESGGIFRDITDYPEEHPPPWGREGQFLEER